LAPVGGGGARHPNSLANLQPAPAAPLGNDRTRRHGGYAAVARDQLAERVAVIYDALAVDAPLRDSDDQLPMADSAIVRLLAEALCRVESVSAHLTDTGWLDQKTQEPRHAVLDLEGRLRREAAGYMEQLGMTPKARAALGVDLARTVDLATAMSEPDPDRRRDMIAATGVDGEVVDDG
jgi:hypothetical protein